ncbi:S49 family peptidase [Candidatus Kaiserbacteria bacterium]|nr:S49 family peptidase [Candidatus Kaiserbacteria bacterium]
MNFSKQQVLVAGLIVLLGALVYVAATQFESEPVDFIASSGSRGKCNVGVISINGQLATYDSPESIDSLRIAQSVRALEKDVGKKAAVLLINSSGGSGPAAEEIGDAVQDLGMPSVAFIREYALSGGYWVAASTDYIVALTTSLVGNIGVTGSYLEETAHNEKEGYVYREFTSGEYKEAGNVNARISPKQREFLQGNVNDLFAIFKDVVKKYRGMTEQQIEDISDGKYYVAEKALALGLVDEIGGIEEVKAYLATRLSVSPEDLLFCEPEEISIIE